MNERLNECLVILRNLLDGVKMLLWRILTAGSYLLVDAGAQQHPCCFRVVVTTPEDAFKFVARTEAML